MQLFVGLGNPGAGHAWNRHNVGFMALDAIVQGHRFNPYRKRFEGRFADGHIDDERIFALKPETFMNLSGQSVGQAMRYYKLAPEQVTVLYDELDLKPGKVRVKVGGGNGGHNGLRSIDSHIGKDYRRVRIGIGHPGDKALVTRYVLGDFSKADQAWLDRLLPALAEAAPLLVRGDDNGFMNKIAVRMAPPREDSAGAVKPGGQGGDGL